ncbi:MAG TPA: glycosyltransferase [Bacteroidota bacterium]|nr:glycosyltransferase [Bacteroidota bacterium]
MNSKKRILVAPLDWGLGHATRCIPIIRELGKHDCEVIVAADGRPYELLKREFPSLMMVRLPGISISYPEKGNMALGIIMQFPSIIASILREHRAMKKIHKELRIDGIVSDNRFGLFTKKIPSVYVTHQIAIEMPRSFLWASQFVRWLHKAVIRRYTECWIPDFDGEKNLSGKLSHGFALPKNAKFVGPLSRMERISAPSQEYEILVVLSGPEPQRTVFENMLVEQLKFIPQKTLLVRGIPEKNQRIRISDSCIVVSHLDSDALNKAMAAAAIIIARPGYSTIMDLDALGKKAILIPTPGQTEQEYLAQRFRELKIFFTCEQKEFVLEKALKKIEDFSGLSSPMTNHSLLISAIDRFVALCNREISAALK